MLESVLGSSRKFHLQVPTRPLKLGCGEGSFMMHKIWIITPALCFSWGCDSKWKEIQKDPICSKVTRSLGSDCIFPEWIESFSIHVSHIVQSHACAGHCTLLLGPASTLSTCLCSRRRALCLSLAPLLFGLHLGLATEGPWQRLEQGRSKRPGYLFHSPG